MVRTRYYDPQREVDTEGVLHQGEGVAVLVATVLRLSSGRGHPAVELTRGDGSMLSLATDGERAALVWVDSLGGSHHSVGEGAGDELVYDYFGSWSEAPRRRLLGHRAQRNGVKSLNAMPSLVTRSPTSWLR